MDDFTLAEHLTHILLKKRSPLFADETRDDATNYALGLLHLRNNGVKAILSNKGPYAKHFLEWVGYSSSPEDLAEYCKVCISALDKPLIAFWCGLYNYKDKSVLKTHAKELIKREAALSANGKFVDELQRLRFQLATYLGQ